MTRELEDLVLKAERLPGLGSVLSPAEVAWAAGLFEGEGNINVHRKRRGKDPGASQILLQLSMTDLDVLQRLQKLLGGRVNGPYVWKGHRKPIWRWHAGSKRQVDEAVCLLFPWLGSRRQWQIREAYLRAGRGLPFEEGG